MRVVVGRIGRAHGIRGDCAVEVRTDEPDRRFAPGTVLLTDSPTRPRLVVERMVWHSGRLLVHFEGIDDRTGAEGVRGLLLEVDVPEDEVPEGEDEYYDRQLVGLRVELPDGTVVGSLREVVHLPAYEMLAVERADRPDALIPFISEFVPVVDVVAGRVVIDPPDGLLDIDVMDEPAGAQPSASTASADSEAPVGPDPV